MVQGQLRLSKTYTTRVECVSKIWELVTTYDCDKDDDDDDVSWALVHDVKVTKGKIGQTYVAALHPVDGDMVFLYRDLSIYQYEIKAKRNEKVGQFPGVIKRNLPKYLDAFGLVHPLWPTTLPSLPSI